MNNDKRSANQIEHDIERHRAELTANLEALQEKLSINGMVREVSQQVRAHGGDFGQSLSRTMRENPIPATLIAIGLGWMMFGKKSSSHRVAVDSDVAEPTAVGVHAHATPAYQSSRAPAPSWLDDASGI